MKRWMITLKTLASQEKSIESLDGYANFIKSYIKPLTEDDKMCGHQNKPT
jgi:hypothetical protein